MYKYIYICIANVSYIFHTSYVSRYHRRPQRLQLLVVGHRQTLSSDGDWRRVAEVRKAPNFPVDCNVFFMN